LNAIVGCHGGHPCIQTNFFDYSGSHGSSEGYNRENGEIERPEQVIEFLIAKFWEYIQNYES
jgi:hypothetical protein